MFATFDLSGDVYQEGAAVGAQRLWVFDPEPQEPLSGEAAWTVEQSIEAYIGAKCPNPRTAAGYRTIKRKWGNWLRNHRCMRPMIPQAVTTGDLEAFLAWVEAEAETAGDRNPQNTRNKTRQSLLAVWHWLARQGHISAVVRFPDRVQARTVAGQYFLRRAEISAIYEAAGRLRSPRLWKDSRPLSDLWQAAIVLMYFYGLDTRAIFYEAGKQQLGWQHVFNERLPPGRVANVACKYGWIRWERQKTGMLLLLPIHPVVRAHLERIRPQRELFERGGAIFGRAGGTDPNERFRQLVAAAGLPAKIDPITSRPVRYVLKDLRKTCATAYGAERARLILGHTDGTITERHYANRLPEVLRAVKEIRVPRAFRGTS
jgi:integrase